MKLKRAAVVAGLVICLIGVNIRGTFGLEEAGIDGNEQNAASQTGETVPGQAVISEAGGTESTDVSGEGITPENPDEGIPENPGDGTTPENPGDGTTPENPGDQTTPENPGDGTTPENPGDQTTPENPGDGTTPENPGDQTTPENPGQGNPGGGTEALQPSQPSGDGSGEETPSFGSGQVFWDDSADAVYTGNLYRASDLYVDNRDKVKYNVALPIEGLPNFITQEMVIGALKCQDETGFPASVTIAQIIQESGFGKYGPEGEKGQGLSYLAYQYNNLFGIKGTGPAGSVNMKTGEQTPAGESYMTTAGFRVYNTYTESIEDRTNLLKEVYSDLIEGAADANTFAMRIGGRWATDIQYAQSLIKQMETYDLYRLDKMTLQAFSQMIGKFANPCPGSTVTSNFGWRDFTNSFHRGIDLGTGAYNIPTYAAEAGTVITAGWNDSAGNWIIIDHGNGLVTKYMHHDKMYVKEGQHVEKGQQIGLSGTTGNSTGNHLHFQVEENGAAVDPAPYLGLTQQ